MAFSLPQAGTGYVQESLSLLCMGQMLTLAHTAEEIAIRGERTMRGFQKDKKCEIADRGKAVEIEIEKKKKAL